MFKSFAAIFFISAFLSLGPGQAVAQVSSPGGYQDPGGGNDPRCLPPGDLDDITNGPPDPGADGPFPVWQQIYDYGYDAANVPGFAHPVEMRGEVTFPIDLDCGPYPIVFIMHGNHPTCIDQEGKIYNGWPCREDQPAPCPEDGHDPGGTITTGGCREDDTPLYNHLGYGYFARMLASHGFIVVSVSANGINAHDGDIDDRAELFQMHMELWDQFNTLGGAPFGNLFIGSVDMDNIGMVGHSRGGGGVARHVALNAAAGFPFNVKAVFMIGAVDNHPESHVIADLHLGVLLPYCDGDQQGLPSVRYFDESRYGVAGDLGAKHTFLVMGANHNFYNEMWDPNIVPFEAYDDWNWSQSIGTDKGIICQTSQPQGERLTSIEQQGTLNATAGAFFRSYLKDEKAFLPFLRGDSVPPPSAMTDEIYVGYMPKDDPDHRLDVNPLGDPADVTTNILGGAVFDENFATFQLCDLSAPGPWWGCLTNLDLKFNSGRAPHGTTDSAVNQLKLAWKRTRIETKLGALLSEAPVFENELPAGYRNVSSYRALQFRALVDFTDLRNPFRVPQDLSVELEDGAGIVEKVAVSDYSDALVYPPSVKTFDEIFIGLAIPHAVFNTVRVPLSAFTPGAPDGYPLHPPGLRPNAVRRD